MKTKMYVWVAVATLFFASCSKEVIDVPATVPSEKSARLELVVKGTPTVTGRATGAALPTAEDNIKTLAVGVFNGDGSVNVIAEPTLAAGVLSAINCTPGTVNVIVVANAPTGTFAGVTTKSAFISKTLKLSATEVGGVQTSDNLPMSGTAAGVLLEAGKTKAESVELSRLVARISIKSIKAEFDQVGANKGATFKVTKVFMYNAMSTSTIEAVGSDPIHGGEMAGGTWTDGTSWLCDAVTATANIDYTTPHWFYTFANDGQTTPTKLVIEGEFDADGAGAAAPTTMYYPIVVNKKQNGTSIIGGAGDAVIARNATYALAAVIKNKGVEDPKQDIDPAALELTVSVAAWALNVTQDVTFE